MAEDDNNNYKAHLTIKLGHANQHVLHVRGESVTDLVAQLGELADHGMVIVTTIQDLMGQAAVVNAFPGTQKVEGNFSTNGTPDSPPFTPTQAVAANDGVKRCAHGAPMLYKEGKSPKTGKDYKAWFCQVENDPSMPKCAAIWLN